MFDFIRNHKRWMQFILLLLIVPSFVFVGAQGYSTFTSSNTDVATVGDTAITSAEFESVRRNFLDEQRNRLGARFDLARVDTPVVRSQLLDDLINQRLLATVAQQNRFSVSDEALRNTIASNPAVQDEGQFSPERYRQALAAQGMTPAMYEAGVRRDLSVQRVIAPVGGSTQVPQAVTARLDSALTQTRTVRTRVFNADDYRSQIKVSDADIKAWYDANQKALEVPQSVDVQYIVLDEAAATHGVKVTDAQIAEHFERNQSRFSRPERRRASHIMIELPSGASEAVRKQAMEKAEEVAKQAKADPAAFADLARKNSQDAGSASSGGDLGWVSATILPPTLFAAVQSLKLDEVSGVVESPSGFHVLKLTGEEPAQKQSLAEVRGQLEEEVRKELAAKQFDTMGRNLTAAVNDQTDSLDPAAKASGLTLRSAAGITRTNLLPADEVGKNAASASPDAQMLDDPRVRQALFTPEVLDQKLNASIITLDAAKLLAIRVSKVTPQRVPELATVTDRIRDTITAERAAQAARAAGEALVKSLQASAPAAPAATPGTPASASATPASANGQAAPAETTATPAVTPEASGAQGTSLQGFGAPQVVSRQDAGSLSQTVLLPVLRMPATALPGYTGVVQGDDYVVVRLDKIEAGQIDPALRDNLNTQINDIWGEAENRAVIQMLREQYKVKVLPEAARVIEGDPSPAG